MIKVLEFVYDTDTKASAGGRNGYVYNILASIKNNEQISINTLHRGKMYVRTDRIPVIIKSLTKVFRENKKIDLYIQGNYEIKDLNSYDVIHFQRSIDLFQYRKALESFRGKVVLTDHSPIPPFSEWYENYFSEFTKKFGGKQIVERYKKCLEESYYLADYILFPCEYSDEAYPSYWENYTKIKRDNISKYVYLPTGSISKESSANKDETRREYGWENKFVACYVGRHNYSKGYDILKDIGKLFLNNYNNQIVVCGQEGPFFAPDFVNWKEIGWTSEANKFISASDVFILPNRETYFDLVMLEALSIGQIVVASRTGGNKYFESFTDSGIFLYDSVEEAVEILNNIENMSENEREELRTNNRLLYKKIFTTDEFGKRYMSFYQDIVEGNVKKHYC